MLVITGPTASGKSSLAVEIASRCDGEIISADSRQIYRGMNIGTGKVTRDEMQGIPHHLLDIRDPLEDYNVTDFVRDARASIGDIKNQGKTSIICGGTVFWIQALIDNQSFPEVPPDPKLRQTLNALSKEGLFTELIGLDPARAETIDRNNPVRLIRAIEIARAGVKNLRSQEMKNKKNQSSGTAPLSCSIIVLAPPFTELKEKIRKRLNERFSQGMIEEVQNLHQTGVPWERLEHFGLEYRFITQFLQEKLSKPDMREQLYYAIVHYAKRQLTWLRRWERQGARIHRFADAKSAFAFLEKEETMS